jgi:hypothetical protein
VHDRRNEPLPQAEKQGVPWEMAAKANDLNLFYINLLLLNPLRSRTR